MSSSIYPLAELPRSGWAIVGLGFDPEFRRILMLMDWFQALQALRVPDCVLGV